MAGERARDAEEAKDRTPRQWASIKMKPDVVKGLLAAVMLGKTRTIHYRAWQRLCMTWLDQHDALAACRDWFDHPDGEPSSSDLLDRLNEVLRG